ncbi:MAG TPA: oxidoreductase [Pseudonocardiaceae bacterium]|nr:oxidoreductase [Pseudonocardiaceae bacterium]
MARTWLITGSSRGFGRKLAEAVLASGDSLVATARTPEQLADLVKAYPDQARAVALDVTDAGQARAAVKTAVTEFGRLDVVVNNAGYANVSAIEDTSDEDFRAQIEANLWGTINVSQAALTAMRPQGAGHIIQFSSIGGRVGGTPGIAPYQTAKFGVEGFSRVLANEVGPLGIKVTIVEPGSFRTDWAGSSMQIADIAEDYQSTLGMIVKYRQDRAGNEPGDPAKAAQVLLKVADLAEPPLQLLLGKDAVSYARAELERQAAEVDKFAELSESTDY